MKNLGYYNGKYDEIEKMSIPMLDREYAGSATEFTTQHMHIITSCSTWTHTLTDSITAQNFLI